MKARAELHAAVAKATSLVREPEVFDKPYKGMGSKSGGVVDMIEIIKLGFARLESETSADVAET